MNKIVMVITVFFEPKNEFHMLANNNDPLYNIMGKYW